MALVQIYDWIYVDSGEVVTTDTLERALEFFRARGGYGPEVAADEIERHPANPCTCPAGEGEHIHLSDVYRGRG